MNALVEIRRPGPAPLMDTTRQAQFCEALASHGNVRLACRATKVSPQTAYRARRVIHDFATCWDAALVLARDHAEQVLADRALNGVEEAVYYHGEEVAVRRRYDSRLLLAHLARLDRLAEAQGDAPAARDFDGALERLAAGVQIADRLDVQADETCGEGGEGEIVDPLTGETVPLMEMALRMIEREEAESEAEGPPQVCDQDGVPCVPGSPGDRGPEAPSDGGEGTLT